MISSKTTAPKRITKVQAANFWERNLAFMTEKESKRQAMDKRFNKDLTFKPEILPKSREISQSRSRS